MTFVPAQAIHPGEFLGDELEARGWTQDDLAEITGISRRQIINLLQGKSGITPDTALKLSQAFEQDAHIWMHYQVTYELATEALKDRSIRRRAAVFDKVPVRELKRRGWINDTNDADSLEDQVCRLLEIESINSQPHLSVAARHSGDYAFTNSGQLAWYCCVKKLGERTTASEYDDSRLNDCIVELKRLTAYPENVRTVPSVLAKFGIRLVFIERFQKSKVDGVALWLDGIHPVIGMSLRFARIDNFWFTLFHELVHIKYRDESPVDEDLCAPDTMGSQSEIEERANREAADYLVPTDKLESFIARHSGLYYEREVVRFAQSQGVHPALVVGQLQCRKEITYKQLHKYLPYDRGILIGQALTDGWGTVLELED